MMRKRSKAREYALQILYQADLRRGEMEEIVGAFWEQFLPPSEVRTFAEQLVRGTLGHLSEIDGLIASYANNWSLKRMGVVDRNILRLGTFELRFSEEVPPKVSINEAVELAKRFGDAESGKFVNGILDAVHKSVAPRAAQPLSGQDQATGEGGGA